MVAKVADTEGLRRPRSPGIGYRAVNGARRKTRPPLPPGPIGCPISGTLPEFARDQLGFLTRCAREYGDVVRMRVCYVPIVLLNHPDHTEHVLASRTTVTS